MLNKLDKQENSKPARDEKGRLLPGNTANPKGRPKGKTLKEWLKDKLQGMTEEERTEFLKDIPKDLQWRMAEGNPATTVGGDDENPFKIIIEKAIYGEENKDTLPIYSKTIPNSAAESDTKSEV